MRTLTWIACLWPGLAALWVRGRWQGMVTAVVFGILLNGALLATCGPFFVVTEAFGWAMPVAAWGFVLGFWALAMWFDRTPGLASSKRRDDWFSDAQTHYLKGHWIEAETLLGKLLSEQPEDVEARLLLAAVLRRTGRGGEAKRLLAELSHDESAAHWRWEIQSEMSRLAGNEEQRSEMQRKAA